MFGDATYAHDQMGVYVPESFLSREISTAAGEFEAHGFPVMHSGSQLVVRLKDLGGTDTNAVINALDVAPQKRLRFDFGTAASPLAPLYTRVTPATRYQPVSGFGWLAGAVDARSRSGADPLTRDFNFSRDATFAVDLPEAGYTVTVTVGDAAAAHDRIGIWVENEPMVEIGAVAAGHFVTRSFSIVLVTDGQLTVRLEDRGGADANAVINALVVSAP